MSDLDNAREVLTAYDELVDALRARVAELEAELGKFQKIAGANSTTLGNKMEELRGCNTRVAKLETVLKKIAENDPDGWEASIARAALGSGK